MEISNLIDRMTLEEKAALLQGWSTWTTRQIRHLGIPSMFLADGPVGLRKQKGSADHLGLNESLPATCFPTPAAMANTWNVALAEEMGRALGAEAAANDVHVVLGPGLNIKRNPLCGRNFEYFSEDPYLSGKMAAACIRGIQAHGIAACPKHFAVNSQELRRMAMDAVVDERTLREIYLTGFEMAVKEGGAKSIMSAYNRVNGVYANENAHLLQEILRQEWGFDGFVVTDWGADNDHTAGVRAGCNLVMPAPGPDCAIGLVEDVKAGKIQETVLDQRVEELLKVVFSTQKAVKNAPKTFDIEAHHALARRCAAEGIVLLENDGILPLAKGASVAVIGDFAKTPRYQGAGSSQVNPTRMEDLYTCLQGKLTISGYAQGYDRKDPQPRQALIEEAVAAAKQAETVLLCIGLEEILESEGMDRLHMTLSPSQQALTEAVCAANDRVILVLSGGAPFVMPPSDRYRAAIHGYLGGQAGAAAMADALLGIVNPSGKLNETWPNCLEDAPSSPYFPGPARTSEYREGLFVGYRYFDTAQIPVRYPFGHGLSYTGFAYSDLQVSQKQVQFMLTNTGAVAGAEVAQVYVSCLDGKVFRPKKELKGFAKVFLHPGESKTVTIGLDDKAFRYFDVQTNRWEVEGGTYEITVAASVSDIHLTAQLQISGKAAAGHAPACYRSGQIQAVSDADFAALLGRSIPDGSWRGDLDANDALCQLYYAKSAPARWLFRALDKARQKAMAKGDPDLNILFIYNMPLRAIAKFSNGWVTRRMVNDLVLACNGHFFRGMGKCIADFFRGQAAGKRYRKQLQSQEKA